MSTTLAGAWFVRGVGCYFYSVKHYTPYVRGLSVLQNSYNCIEISERIRFSARGVCVDLPETG